MSSSLLARAGSWFLNSGIQESNGGVARYYLSDQGRNARISTEITGYAASTLVYLHDITGDPRYLEAAVRAADFLVNDAWSPASATIPFEPVSNGDQAYVYFFDCGIIIRGLLAVWRITQQPSLLERAREIGLSMAFDFIADGVFHPVLTLPDKQPLDYQPRWSRQPGCYQAKSAMGWYDLGIAVGDVKLAQLYESVLAFGIRTHADFLPGSDNPERVMDRLHAYGYFLESLLPLASRADCRDVLTTGIERMSLYLRQIASMFERSDVYAQLLRLRLFTEHAGVLKLNEAQAAEEAAKISEFQLQSADPHNDGGFSFGRKSSAYLPFTNPVSTAFCLQAIAMWQERQAGHLRTKLASLI